MARRRYANRSRRQVAGTRVAIVRNTGAFLVAAVGFVSAVLGFKQNGLNYETLTIIALATALGLSLLANGLLYLRNALEGDKPKQIAFLTPSSGEQPFYTSMLSGLVQSASLAHGQDYVILPSMPGTAFEAVSIWSLFSSLEDRQVDISGIIFIPDKPDDHFEDLVGFHEDRGDIPLVLVDVFFNLDACDDRTKKRLPSFVGGNELLGGRLAAEIMASALGDVAHPTVLIVNGGFAPWEMQRSRAFRDEIRRRYPGVQFVETPPFNYSREAARRFATEFLPSVATASGVIPLDGVFACNDDMAIGIRSAVVGLSQSPGVGFARTPQIVGYDGIQEMREYMDHGDPYIAGTVDVRIQEQAKAALMMMHQLLRHGRGANSVKLVDPVALYTSARSQSGGV